jgi:hypothetical protein
LQADQAREKGSWQRISLAITITFTFFEAFFFFSALAGVKFNGDVPNL